MYWMGWDAENNILISKSAKFKDKINKLNSKNLCVLKIKNKRVYYLNIYLNFDFL